MAKSKETQADKVVAVPSKVWVQRTVKRAKEPELVIDEDEEIIAIHKFVTTPAIVTASIPFKKSHDYSSAGITIGVQIPCYREEIENAIEAAELLVKKRMAERLPDILRTAYALSQAKPEE